MRLGILLSLLLLLPLPVSLNAQIDLMVKLKGLVDQEKLAKQLILLDRILKSSRNIATSLEDLNERQERIRKDLRAIRSMDLFDLQTVAAIVRDGHRSSFWLRSTSRMLMADVDNAEYLYRNGESLANLGQEWGIIDREFTRDLLSGEDVALSDEEIEALIQDLKMEPTAALFHDLRRIKARQQLLAEKAEQLEKTAKNRDIELTQAERMQLRLEANKMAAELENLEQEKAEKIKTFAKVANEKLFQQGKRRAFGRYLSEYMDYWGKSKRRAGFFDSELAAKYMDGRR